MDRQEAIQTLSKVGKISVSYAEDLYDSFFPKPVVPQFVADWYEEHKDDLNSEIYYLIRYWEDEERNSDFYKWFDDTRNEALITLVNMHQFGYELEKEPRYTVRIVGITADNRYLSCGISRGSWFLWSNEESQAVHTRHTRKELEANGFGWVFDCEGVEVKEVTDE